MAWLYWGQIRTQTSATSCIFIDVCRNDKYGMPANLCIGGLCSPRYGRHVVLRSSLPRFIVRRPGLFEARLHEEENEGASVKNNIVLIIVRFMLCVTACG